MQISFAQKTSKAFLQALFLFFGVVGLLIFVFLKIYEKIILYAPIVVHKITMACNCSQMAQLSNHPYIFVVLGILALLATVFIIHAFYQLISLLVRTRKYSANYLKLTRLGLSAKLRRTLEEAGLKKSDIIEIKSKSPVVFCFGIYKARICVSSGLVKILKNAELKAVLLHEGHHLKSHDPLKLFVLKYFQNTLFFVPGLKMVIKKYVTFSELAADEKATNNFNDRSILAKAIFKVTQKEESNLLVAGLALSFFSSVIAERVNRLSDNNYSPKFKLFGQGLILGLLSITVTSLLLFVFLADTSKAFGASGGSCAFLQMSQADANVCKADNYAPTSQINYVTYYNNNSSC